jgi:hypothetical protein
VKKAQVRALVDRLVARDGGYRPLELLKRVRRLESRDEQRWLRGEIGFLEDRFYGDPSKVVELLRLAADWARQLELAEEDDTAIPREAGRVFRNGVDDRLARMAWQRRQVSQQADLFFDNGQATSRRQLQRALLAGDRVRAEQHLAELARSQPDSEILADAEHLVGALGWLQTEPEDVAALLQVVDDNLVPRACRLLGGEEAGRYLSLFWKQLAASLDPTRYDPGNDRLHPSALHERAADWPATVDAALAVPDRCRHADLLKRLARAGIAGQRRDLGWQALALLCWHHPDAAESFLEANRDEEFQRRIEQYWDLEPPLPVELFPAWLATLSFALPELPEDGTRGSRALAGVLSARTHPDDPSAREWLANHEPELMRRWLATGRG